MLCRIIGLLTVAALAIAAAPGRSGDETFARARDLYIKAVDGDRDAARESDKLFSSLLDHRPDDPVLVAYLGSLRLLESGRTLAVWRRGRLAKEGLSALDRAVSLAPDHPEVRFLRAISTSHLPSYFGRSQQAEADLRWLSVRVQAAVSAGTLDGRYAAAALYRYGLVLERSSEPERAREMWMRATRISPESRAATDAERKLKAGQ